MCAATHMEHELSLHSRGKLFVTHALFGAPPGVSIKSVGREWSISQARPNMPPLEARMWPTMCTFGSDFVEGAYIGGLEGQMCSGLAASASLPGPRRYCSTPSLERPYEPEL